MRADLVLEGGGVKGIALVGAISALHEAGYTFERIGGTSAGAIAGSLVAAGATPDQLDRMLRTVDYGRFTDLGLLDRFGPLGIGLSLLLEKGIFEGDALREWLRERLEALGVRTFGDLRRRDEGSALAPERRYRLVAMVADVSRGRLVRLPWDYPDYGLDPDDQLVCDAVFASAAIPLFYEPVRLEHRDGVRSYLVDGGLLSNFPIGVFDRDDGLPPRWPTIGIKLSARPDAAVQVQHDVRGPVSYLRAIISTAMTAHDQKHLDDPCAVRRTVFVDATGVNPLDFALTPAMRDDLYRRGRAAAKRWLETWDFDDYKAVCRDPAADGSVRDDATAAAPAVTEPSAPHGPSDPDGPGAGEAGGGGAPTPSPGDTG